VMANKASAKVAISAFLLLEHCSLPDNSEIVHLAIQIAALLNEFS